MKRLMLHVSLSLGIMQALAQKDIATLHNDLEQSVMLSDSLDLLLEISEYYIYNDSEQAAIWTEQLLSLARESRDSAEIIQAHLQYGKMLAFSGALEASKQTIRSVSSYSLENNIKADNLGNYLGNIYSALNDLDSAVYFYGLGMEHTEDSLQKGIILSNIAGINESLGKSAQASEEYLQAIAMIKVHEDADKYLSSIYLNAGSLKSNMNKHREAALLYLQSIESAKKSGMAYWEGFSSINLAGKYDMHLNQMDSAYFYYQNAKSIFSQLDDPTMNSLLWSRMAEYFSKTGQPDSSIHYLKKADALIEYMEDFDQRQNVIHDLANYYMKQGDLRTAGQYIQRMERANIHKNGLFYQDEFLMTAAKYHRSAGNYQQSVNYLFDFIAVHDSISGIEQNNRISELEIQYETAEKDNEIATLQQENEIANLQIQNRNYLLVLVAIGVLLSIVGSWVYYNRKSLLREKSYLDLEQRFLRSQLNPHFIFNSLTVIQNYIRENDAINSEAYVGLFGKLMRQILEHSRQEYITLEDEIDTLTNYLQLQQLRFDQTFSFKIQVDETLDEEFVMIPPMFAQPFIENSLEHGLFQKGTDNQIKISFKAEGKSKVKLEIQDNGVGLVKAKQKNHQSLATKITQERLQKFQRNLKTKFELTVHSISSHEGEAQGTLVGLTVPAQQSSI
jgi:tetratricopeptide (TPR) repeat protein